MMSSASVLYAALWLSAIVSVAVAGISLSSGVSPSWVVLRAVGAFVVFMLLGLVAEAITRHGLAQAAQNRAEQMMRAEAAGETSGEASPGLGFGAAETPLIEPEILTTAEVKEDKNEAA